MDEWLKLFMEEGGGGRPAWDPDFVADRWLVHARLGPFERFYLRPPAFRKRFYHRLYPLPVRLWSLAFQHTLQGGLCRLAVDLRIRYQITVEYVRAYPEALADLDRHVEQEMAPLIADLVEYRLSLLDDGRWIESGLGEVARDLEDLIHDCLAGHALQCRAVCLLQGEFVDSCDERTALFHENAYRAILQRRRDLEQLRFQERKRLEEEKLQHELALWRQARETEYQREVEEGQHRLKTLQTRQRHLAEQREVEARLQMELLLHQARLEEMELNQRIQLLRRRRQARKILDQDAVSTEGGKEPLRHREDTPVPLDNPMEKGRGSAGAERETAVRKLEFEAALALWEKDRMVDALERQLNELVKTRPPGTALSRVELATSGNWLDQLTQKLLFFLKNPH